MYAGARFLIMGSALQRSPRNQEKNSKKKHTFVCVVCKTYYKKVYICLSN